jgi:hypothetical protein
MQRSNFSSCAALNRSRELPPHFLATSASLGASSGHIAASNRPPNETDQVYWNLLGIDTGTLLCFSTTLLVSPRTERLDLLGLEEPEDEILEEPEQYLPMHGRQRASCHAGGEKPRQEVEAALIGKT